MDVTSIVMLGAALLALAAFGSVVLWVENDYRKTLGRQRAEAAEGLRARPLSHVGGSTAASNERCGFESNCRRL